ncbi:DUF6781 family protein [Caenimonas soli]|uniref:DUF6781 family protein n=1 Tax=Caenimonas soli TaxID=2735555 RepID=UPI0015533C5E|nr:DUF6781 family protein [Caenimonas soli]NPC57380.1 hypothetical protein [Caenimonas soli]
MNKSGIDQDALIAKFAQATAKQGETLRKTVSEATLRALQGRELTLDNIRKVLKSVTQAASAGAAQNPASTVDVEAMLGKAFAGMDAALLQTVEAQRKALQQFIDQGLDLKDKQMKGALGHLEKMEDVFFTTVSKATEGAGSTLQAPWQQVLQSMKGKGTDTGAQAGAAVEQLVERARTALRDGRATSLSATQAMMDSYAALVSGVLIGMSDGLRPVAARADAGRARRR